MNNIPDCFHSKWHPKCAINICPQSSCQVCDALKKRREEVAAEVKLEELGWDLVKKEDNNEQ